MSGSSTEVDEPGDGPFYMNVFRSGREVLLAACDRDLLGRVFREGKVRLDVSRDFYGGFVGDEEDLLGALPNATIANLVGERVVEVAIGAGFVDPECVLRVEGVPHAQVVVYIPGVHGL